MRTPEKHNFYIYTDYEKWEGRWELIDGVPYNMSPAPSWNHQYIVGELQFALRSFLGNKECFVAVAPFDVILSEEDDYEHSNIVVQPDISVICNKKQLFVKGCKGAPALVVEVLSPSTALRDRNDKFKKYQKFGVQEYWIVDPSYKMIEVYGMEEGYFRKKEAFGEEDVLQSFIFPEFRLQLDSIFLNEAGS